MRAENLNDGLLKALLILLLLLANILLSALSPSATKPPGYAERAPRSATPPHTAYVARP